MRPPSSIPSAPAFSLVEVALSLAILAVAMTGILALLPVGLDSARQVHAETVAAGVVRSAIGDFSSNGWTLPAYTAIAQVPDRTTNPILTSWFTTDGVRTNENASPYFRLEYVKVSGSATTPSCRYLLQLSSPAVIRNTNSTVRNPMLQTRTFVTDVLRAAPSLP